MNTNIKTLLRESNDALLNTKISKFEQQLKIKYPQLDEIGLYMDDGKLFLSDLYISPKFRGKGFGSKVMIDIVQFADQYKLVMELIPDALEEKHYFNLITFYKKFGFKEYPKTGLRAADPKIYSMYRNVGGI